MKRRRRCKHCGKLHDPGPQITVCTGSGVRYVPRVRWPGMRRYEVIGKPTTSYQAAVMRMARTFASNRNYKRGDVLMTADYYDPVMVCEIVR